MSNSELKSFLRRQLNNLEKKKKSTVTQNHAKPLSQTRTVKTSPKQGKIPQKKIEHAVDKVVRSREFLRPRTNSISYEEQDRQLMYHKKNNVIDTFDHFLMTWVYSTEEEWGSVFFTKTEEEDMLVPIHPYDVYLTPDSLPITTDQLKEKNAQLAIDFDNDYILLKKTSKPAFIKKILPL